MLSDFQQRFFQYFLDRKQNTFAVKVFSKALIFFVFVKVALLWSLYIYIAKLHQFDPSPSSFFRILFWPAYFASKHPSVFLSLCLLFLTVILFIKWNSIIGFLFFLLVLNLYRLNTPIVNGSDFVLFMLVFWSIGMNTWSLMRNEKWNTILILVFNVSVLLCQFQIVFIYLISGWDKITSEIWRSGDAMSYIYHLDFLYNRSFGSLENQFANLTFSWAAIVFELAFVALVWFRQTRLIVLGIGVIFHLIIWLTLSLPDFALIMIISYLIFLKDTDYKILRKKLKLKPL